MQKGELDSSPFFAFLLRRELSNPNCGLLHQRLAPRARCVQLCFGFKPGGVIRPLPEPFELTLRLYASVFWDAIGFLEYKRINAIFYVLYELTCGYSYAT
jgi:hypothetical protein